MSPRDLVKRQILTCMVLDWSPRVGISIGCLGSYVAVGF